MSQRCLTFTRLNTSTSLSRNLEPRGSSRRRCLGRSGTFDIARLAAGGTYSAISAVLEGSCRNAYALMRPPGHHAERDRGRGFCIFNNIALGVLAARQSHQIERVAVVDWDVHHGNGTQQAFYSDPNVLTISIHQEMLYPVNLGTLSEIGADAGEGANSISPACRVRWRGLSIGA